MTGRRKEVISNLNIVPYLDVMLVLLVIFMATTPIVQTGVTVDLPVGKASTLKSQEPIVLNIDKTGKRSLQLGSENAVAVLDGHAMQKWFSDKGIAKDRAIYLHADRSLSWQSVLSALVEVNQMGWSKVALATQAADEDGSA